MHEKSTTTATECPGYSLDLPSVPHCQHHQVAQVDQAPQGSLALLMLLWFHHYQGHQAAQVVQVFLPGPGCLGLQGHPVLEMVAANSDCIHHTHMLPPSSLLPSHLCTWPTRANGCPQCPVVAELQAGKTKLTNKVYYRTSWIPSVLSTHKQTQPSPSLACYPQLPTPNCALARKRVGSLG